MGGLPKQGDILVALLRNGPRVVRCLGRDGERIIISAGRNRQAKIPCQRLLLATSLSGLSDSDLEAFSGRVAAISKDLDVDEIWRLLAEGGMGETVEYLAELYFDDRPSAAQVAGLAMHLEEQTLYFERRDNAYFARSAEDIRQMLLRDRRQKQSAAEKTRILDDLTKGLLPDSPTKTESQFIEELRSFAVFGDEYARARIVKSLLKQSFTGSGDLQRHAFALLAAAGHLSHDEPLEIERARLPVHFPSEAEEQASAIAEPPSYPDRRDLTDTPTFTIDHPGTLDRDDALSVERLSEDRIRVGIHIADAACLIPIDSAVDQEAYRRISTLYTPEIRVPMVPTVLSDGLCSIVPGQPRPTLTLLATLDDGEVVEWELFPSLVLSTGALTYQEADSSLLGGKGPLLPYLQALNAAANRLRSRRAEAGAYMTERPDLSIEIKDASVGSKRVSVHVSPRDTPSKRIVMEMMVLCNKLMARFCVVNSIPAAYRSQPETTSCAATERNYDPLANYRLMRSIPPAKISTSPERHHGLGVKEYLQATSPIRRFLDLVIQRQIACTLAGSHPPYSEESIAGIAQRAEVQRKELAYVEGQRRRYWILRFFEQRMSEGRTEYDAIVLEPRLRGSSLLELTNYPFRAQAELPSGVSAGDRVALRLRDVDLWRRVAHFIALE